MRDCVKCTADWSWKSASPERWPVRNQLRSRPPHFICLLARQGWASGSFFRRTTDQRHVSGRGLKMKLAPPGLTSCTTVAVEVRGACRRNGSRTLRFDAWRVLASSGAHVLAPTCTHSWDIITVLLHTCPRTQAPTCARLWSARFFSIFCFEHSSKKAENSAKNSARGKKSAHGRKFDLLKFCSSKKSLSAHTVTFYSTCGAGPVATYSNWPVLCVHTYR